MSVAPRVTVVIPVYNREDSIRAAIESCLTQSLQQIEVIVVDDASTDGSVAVVESISDARLSLVKLSENGHVGPARNAGARLANGEWILDLDSDDELAPGALATLWEVVSGRTDIGGVLYPHLLDDGTTAPSVPLPNGEVWDFDTYLKFLESGIHGNNSGHFMLASAVARDIPFSESKPFLPLDEFHRYLRVVAQTRILTLSTPLYLYHQHAASFTGTQSKRNTWFIESDKRTALIGEIFSEFGRQLRANYPTGYRLLSQNRYVSEFQSGHRGRGIAAAANHLSKFPGDLAVWPACVLGLIGPGALAAARARRGR